MMGVAALHVIAVLAARSSLRFRPLERFGRRSLFVYWIHVELVYGYASWPLRLSLPLWGALVACAAFSLLMYGAVVLRDRGVESWRARRRTRSSPEAAVA
jgi:heme A synthase